MNTKDRDLLLVRLDERSTNSWRATEKIEKHLDRLNNSVATTRLCGAVNRRWLIAVTAGGSLVVAGLIGGVLPV